MSLTHPKTRSFHKPLPSPKAVTSWKIPQVHEISDIPDEVGQAKDASDEDSFLIARANTVDLPRRLTMANHVPTTLRKDEKNPLTRAGNRLTATMSAHSLDASFEHSSKDFLDLRLRISTLEDKIRNRKLLRILLQKREQEIEELKSTLTQTLFETELLQGEVLKTQGTQGLSEEEIEDGQTIEVQSEQEETVVKPNPKRCEDPWPRIAPRLQRLKWKLVKFLARKELQR